MALFRPGPLQSGMVDDFIDRKHGQAKVEYPHPDLKPILKHNLWRYFISRTSDANCTSA